MKLYQLGKFMVVDAQNSLPLKDQVKGQHLW